MSDCRRPEHDAARHAAGQLAAQMRAMGCPVSLSGDHVGTVWDSVHVVASSYGIIYHARDGSTADPSRALRWLQLGRAAADFGMIGRIIVRADMRIDGVAWATAEVPNAPIDAMAYTVPIDLARAYIRGQATAGQLIDYMIDRGSVSAQIIAERICTD